jgi:hypothetical protein
LTALIAKEQESVAADTKLIADMTDAFNRLLAKIAAGAPPSADLSAEVAQVQAVIQALTDSNAAKVSADASAQVEGN